MNKTLYAEWPKHQKAALREGWDLFQCGDSASGPLQVQHLEAPEDWKDAHQLDFTPPDLLNDKFAWQIVAAGTGPHHEAAKSLLARFNVGELLRIATCPR